MILEITIDTLAYVVIVLLAYLLGGYIWKRRAMPGGLYFFVLMALMAGWAAVCIAEQVVSDPLVVHVCILLEYLAVTWAGPLWLLFVLDYGYRSRWPVTGKTLLVLVVPAVIDLLALTNGLHGLIWLRSPADLSLLGHGLGLMVNLLYTYALMLAGIVLLIGAAVRSLRKDLLKATTLLVGTTIPIVTSLLYMTGVRHDIIDYVTPFALAATILLYTWSIFGQRLFDLVPWAREVLVRSMADSVIVLDREGRIVDLNPAATKLFGATEASIGQPADVAFSRWPEFARRCRSENKSPPELVIHGAEGPIWVDIRISELCDAPGKCYGRLVALRDITERKLAEDGLRQSNESLQAEVVERKHIEEELKRSNDALQAEISERRRAEESLEESLKEKELLLKEIHHRVKNNLQIISSLLSLQTNTTTCESASATLKESQNRIKSMALIHEKLYMSRDLARIDFREYVQSLIVSLTRSYVVNPGLRIGVEIEDVSLDIDAAIPCGLIINELISNSLKYAFKGLDGGVINVTLVRQGDLYRLVVSDDGVGLPGDIDFRNTPSLGLQLVVTLTDQLNGTIELGEGKGTSFTITFPETGAGASPSSQG